MEKNQTIPLALYKKIYQFFPIVCVDIVVIHRNKFLLGKRSNRPALGRWWFPGGRILKGETLKQAVKRILYEETGLTAKSVKYLGVDETMFTNGKFDTTTHTINIVYAIQLRKTQAKLKFDDQHSEFKWFTNIDQQLHPYIKKFLKSTGFKQ